MGGWVGVADTHSKHAPLAGLLFGTGRSPQVSNSGMTGPPRRRGALLVRVRPFFGWDCTPWLTAPSVVCPVACYRGAVCCCLLLVLRCSSVWLVVCYFPQGQSFRPFCPWGRCGARAPSRTTPSPAVQYPILEPPRPQAKGVRLFVQWPSGARPGTRRRRGSDAISLRISMGNVVWGRFFFYLLTVQWYWGADGGQGSK